MNFCEKCHDEVEITIKNVHKSIVIKGMKIDYKGKEAICLECGNIVFVDEVHDHNLNQINKEYDRV